MSRDMCGAVSWVKLNDLHHCHLFCIQKGQGPRPRIRWPDYANGRAGAGMMPGR